MASKGFMFFDAYFYATTTMTDEQRLEFYDAIIRYAVLRENPNLDGLMSSTFELIRPAIDKSIDMRERGSRGGSAKRKADAEENDNCLQAKSKVLASKNESACNEEKGREEKRREVESEEKRKEEKGRSNSFAPPTLDDVTAYCTERGNGIDPQRFIDYYQSNGWKVGKNPMKDWKAAVRTWEQREAAPKKEDNDKEIRQQYENARNLYPLETKRDEGLDLFMKKAKGDAKIARRMTDKIGELVEMYYNGERCLQTFEKDIEVAYADLRN